MKRTLALLATLLLLMALPACEKETLPVPEYPLDFAAIEAELLEWGFECRLEKFDSGGSPGYDTMYTMNRVEEERYLGSVSSHEREGERVLLIDFLGLSVSQYAKPVALEECEGALAFASHLFGGFESERQVYELFIKEYGTANTRRTEKSGKKPMAESTWSRVIDGTYCQIVLEQPFLEQPEEYVISVIFATDWDTFFLLRRF